MSRVRQDLGKSTPVDLRRLFFSPRSQLRLRRGSRRVYAREDCSTPSQYLALFRAPPPPPKLPADSARGLHATVECAEACKGNRDAQAVREKRRRVPPHAELQRSRGVGGAGASARVRIRYSLMLLDGKPSELGGCASRAQRFQGVDLHPRRS